MRLNRFMIRPLVEMGLREEVGPGDTTGGFLVGDDPVQTGQIYAKGTGVICGLLLADETVRMVDPDAVVETPLATAEHRVPGAGGKFRHCGPAPVGAVRADPHHVRGTAAVGEEPVGVVPPAAGELRRQEREQVGYVVRAARSSRHAP